MNIEHKYLLHMGFSSTIKGRRMTFSTLIYPGGPNLSIYYDTINKSFYTDYDLSERYSFTNRIDELNEWMPKISQESFKLFKRSETINKLLK